MSAFGGGADIGERLILGVLSLSLNVRFAPEVGIKQVNPNFCNFIP